jgi:hypothetical protein
LQQFEVGLWETSKMSSAQIECGLTRFTEQRIKSLLLHLSLQSYEDVQLTKLEEHKYTLAQNLDNLISLETKDLHDSFNNHEQV